jgi:hypothetical protein
MRARRSVETSNRATYINNNLLFKIFKTLVSLIRPKLRLPARNRIFPRAMLLQTTPTCQNLLKKRYTKVLKLKVNVPDR